MAMIGCIRPTNPPPPPPLKKKTRLQSPDLSLSPQPIGGVRHGEQAGLGDAATSPPRPHTRRAPPHHRQGQPPPPPSKTPPPAPTPTAAAAAAKPHSTQDVLSLPEVELMGVLDAGIHTARAAVAHVSEIACPPYQTVPPHLAVPRFRGVWIRFESRLVDPCMIGTVHLRV